MDKAQETAGFLMVNGKEIALPRSGRLIDLMHALNLDWHYVLVELNGQALLKDEIPSTPLRPGDHLELVKPVAGG